MDNKEIECALEAILFAAGERVDVSRLAFTLETDENDKPLNDVIIESITFENYKAQ